jgi:hypothetical protein
MFPCPRIQSGSRSQDLGTVCSSQHGHELGRHEADSFASPHVIWEETGNRKQETPNTRPNPRKLQHWNLTEGVPTNLQAPPGTPQDLGRPWLAFFVCPLCSPILLPVIHCGQTPCMNQTPTTFIAAEQTKQTCHLTIFICQSLGLACFSAMINDTGSDSLPPTCPRERPRRCRTKHLHPKRLLHQRIPDHLGLQLSRQRRLVMQGPRR